MFHDISGKPFEPRVCWVSIKPGFLPIQSISDEIVDESQTYLSTSFCLRQRLPEITTCNLARFSSPISLNIFIIRDFFVFNDVKLCPVCVLELAEHSVWDHFDLMKN